mgnify:CR=1 FL=1
MALITETNAQYYSGQQVFTALSNATNPTFTCTFNTDVVSAYDSTGAQISSASNYTIYLAGVAQAESLSYVSNTYNNVITLRNGPYTGSVYIKLKQSAIDNNYGSYSYISIKDIINNLGKTPKKIYIAPNLVSPIVAEKKEIKKKLRGPLKILFLSRISPMKNLDFFLNVLCKVSSNVKLDIYGIKEDLRYFKQCKKIINKLPKNIRVLFHNKVNHNKINTIFKNHDLFVLPTRGENFGHVIYEALSAGVPALISDKTPWKAKNTGGLEVIPLNETLWVKQIEKWSKFNSTLLYKKKILAINYVKNYNHKNRSIKKNYRLIKDAIRKMR